MYVNIYREAQRDTNTHDALNIQRHMRVLEVWLRVETYEALGVISYLLVTPMPAPHVICPKRT
jgi:hypothetical protein